MESFAKKRSIDLVELVGEQLRANLFPGAHVVLALSGGIDSMTLLDILSRIAPVQGISVRAIHVHHGISKNADAWAEFCSKKCAAIGIPITIDRADLGPWISLGIEGAARAARYELLGRHASDALVLAHHRDDQSETLLVQLLRGSGVAGLAAMPMVREGATKTIRPLLGVSRREIDAYARSAGLVWIEDESNFDQSRTRNMLRSRVLPLLEEHFPGSGARLARSAAHLGEAGELLASLAGIDMDFCAEEHAISLSRLCEIGELRAKNLIRHWTRGRGFPFPSTAALKELWRQVRTSRLGRNPELRVAGATYRCYRGRLYLDRHRDPPASDLQLVWAGESAIVIVEMGGVIRFSPEEGRGLSVSRLRAGVVTVRARRGGERIQLHFGRPRRTLKNLMQERGIPSWRREFTPLVYCDETLVSVPGVGEDCRWHAQPGERGVIVSWNSLD